MTTKHTPGPWEKADGTDGITRGVRGWHGPEMVNVINWNGISRATSVTGQANARLIVAAPDLLEALQELCEIVEDAIEQKSAKDLDSFTLQPARAAIAKATGEQP